MLHRQVHAEVRAIAIRSLSGVDQLLRDCTYGRPTPHFPTYVLHRGSVALRDLSMLQGPCSKHTARHRVQKSPDAKAERCVGMGLERIDSSELQREGKPGRSSSDKRPQNLQPLWPVNSGQVSARVSLQ